jgi:acyl-CoA thioester hydrolase
VHRDEFTFRHALRVRWAEVDRQGVVFNPQYFAYFDVAVTEYWRAVGVRYPDDFSRTGTDTFAVSARAEFHGSAGYDDIIHVCCRVGRIGRSSMQFLFGVYRDEAHLTSGEIVYVNASIDTRQPTGWSQALRDAIIAFEKTPPS